ncbi:MAG: N-acetylglucosaminyldiphosphoundecaprenol N-acetyl-beta-D-mannosaminyltransferase, partial [Thermoleophilaceae bacterium]|nr:N-acetylglucosaminyldiphosphoundecaprenol N-acetyl-beta-D-mannosaminyltransferase [Thermoleophilaceae bacterium]
KWMARMRDKLEVPVMCAVGAAFDFHAGRISQAPAWMQRRGLEWTYRIAQEPRRLLPRYLYYNPRFMSALGRQVVKERRGAVLTPGRAGR